MKVSRNNLDKDRGQSWVQGDGFLANEPMKRSSAAKGKGVTAPFYLQLSVVAVVSLLSLFRKAVIWLADAQAVPVAPSAPAPAKGPVRVHSESSEGAAVLYLKATARTAAAETPSAAPYPPSPVIQSLAWAPKETIRRAARGSDRFPITWADDDALYTAWGDGKGFGGIEKKLSLGYARVTGPPEAFSAEDIRSPTGEDTGDGRRGFKASGLLSLAGTLYLWVGNADKNGRQSQLAWSADRGRTWTWAGWRFAEFGYLSLVQPMGRGPGRDRQFPGQVDRRRWPQVMAGFFRR